MRTHTDNFQRGLDILAKIDPENYKDIMAGFEQSALPDLGTLAVEFNYGQIFSRPGLDLKSRLLAAVAGLTALGNTKQLKFYINGALNGGWTQEEILEAMLQMVIYAGFPVALNTILTVANEVFSERTERNKKEKQNDY
ncbi:carboxymuconolactone decarboxylase family protein [Priestia megaterium]|jgi:4-carboxymuconolactone decarboxylase|uniref:Gamma-carboxymuconolactone decarboxylase n=1 Tax=Priestia megaterium (strain ATCC 14581 / DSM 32 / CCUG 1817 / JCM 2506 / NBRC 15308 / NCIMB 9376 / NCTC 10342 / NRRL B-14308 / VKM B-512 / Ford 19) TaxID=1348623 RepID=A0A0B6AGT0_PRIM2|nr:carboxymuconolactone decarboxylase family protein [Priestia megaterium]AJI20252.1 gamma-carboxymuconolactone decarboxylase [Priestia megaterium NBRC 15308 = ATCC 14581]KFN05496.1 gamma-carboxymuconolactone decarboxylase [Priestia megaterium]KGJ78839.1 carboxymuconolactone decarboxylase [Priestia megaterium NBRC 15308 = ATCC 14581]MDR4234842.1 carboxymuconolactone decarboxylase family protein [Priestia megaterium]MED3805042.1 carboxymuconolactone decarboxylase family protein [Priestia megate